MKIIIIKKSGHINECHDISKYEAIALNHPAVEISSRSSRKGKGSVAIYSPTILGLSKRIWGTSLINAPIQLLRRSYVKLFSVIGFNPTKAAWISYLKVLGLYNQSNKYERWVVFFK